MLKAILSAGFAGVSSFWKLKPVGSKSFLTGILMGVSATTGGASKPVWWGVLMVSKVSVLGASTSEVTFRFSKWGSSFSSLSASKS